MTNNAGHIDFQTASCLPDFPPISLEEMREVRLMDRVDTKYVTNETVLLQILAEANRQGYRALESVCGKIQPYDSIYFDTGCMDMYRDHHNRRQRRIGKRKSRLAGRRGVIAIAITPERKGGLREA